MWLRRAWATRWLQSRCEWTPLLVPRGSCIALARHSSLHRVGSSRVGAFFLTYCHLTSPRLASSWPLFAVHSMWLLIFIWGVLHQSAVDITTRSCPSPKFIIQLCLLWCIRVLFEGFTPKKHRLLWILGLGYVAPKAILTLTRWKCKYISHSPHYLLWNRLCCAFSVKLFWVILTDHG